MKRLEKLRKKYIDKCLTEIQKSFNKIKYKHLGKFGSYYRNYIPEYYNRRYELYKIPRIEIDRDNETFQTYYDSERLTKWYRIYKKLGPTLGKEYIYQLSFVDGFHGGARSGPPDDGGNPFPGNKDKPYWRTPPPPEEFPIRYSKWGNPAVKTRSPKMLIEDDFKNAVPKIIFKYGNQFQEEVIKKLKEFINKNR